MKNIDKYVDAYFEGTLSDAQEKRLKAFLCSREGRSPEYDEIRAVMGYFAMGSVRRRTSPVWPVIGTVAAALLLFVGVGLLHQGSGNVCVAYVGGVKVSDREAVIRDMEHTLSDLISDGPDVENELSEFFAK